MNILVLNAGSSTIKFNFFQVKNQNSITSLAKGKVANLNEDISSFSFSVGDYKIKDNRKIGNHEHGIKMFMEELNKSLPQIKIDTISFRVVHGGDFTQIQDAFKTKEQIYEIAHKFTKAHEQGLKATVNYFLRSYPHIPQYFDFDTLYHIKTLTPECYVYALPQDKCKELGIRKYGEHGLSHQYIAEHSTKLFGKNQVVISCHLGSGSSISCIYNGKCVDNSMGLTPLAGVVMSTRCGNIDPSTITYMMKAYNLTPDQMDDIMNLQSGLKGICGDGDMQKVTLRMLAGDKRASLAFNVAVNSYIKSIGGKIFQLGDKIKKDLSNLKIVFTAGIGENSSLVREKIIEKFAYLNIKLDSKKNNSTLQGDRKISSKSSTAEVWILPTDEEIVIAKDTYEFIRLRSN